jgi:hypothetical protein
MKYLILAAAIVAISMFNGGMAYAGCGGRHPVRNMINKARTVASERPVATCVGNALQNTGKFIQSRPVASAVSGSCSSCSK